MLQRMKSGRALVVGPWWLRFSAALGGWSLYAFRRRLAWKPIDYSRTFIVEGEGRTARLPAIRKLDLGPTPTKDSNHG